MPARRLLPLALSALFLAQLASAYALRHSFLPLGDVPQPPSPALIAAMGLGDTEIFYRASGVMLQQLGREGRRVDPLSALDYTRLIGWFDALTSVDARAYYAPGLAASYFAQSQNPAQTRLVLDFLSRLAARQPSQWPWLVEGIDIAEHKLGDRPRAEKFADQLDAIATTHPDAALPFWTRQLRAYLAARDGRLDEAAAILAHLMEVSPAPPEEERALMREQIEAWRSHGASPRIAPLTTP